MEFTEITMMVLYGDKSIIDVKYYYHTSNISTVKDHFITSCLI